jgi:hypothetical protein
MSSVITSRIGQLCLDRSVDVAVDVIGADPVDHPDDLANDAEREPLASHVPTRTGFNASEPGCSPRSTRQPP